MAHGEDFDPSNYRRYELINKIFHYGIRDAEFDSVSTEEINNVRHVFNDADRVDIESELSESGTVVIHGDHSSLQDEITIGVGGVTIIVAEDATVGFADDATPTKRTDSQGQEWSAVFYNQGYDNVSFEIRGLINSNASTLSTDGDHTHAGIFAEPCSGLSVTCQGNGAFRDCWEGVWLYDSTDFYMPYLRGENMSAPVIAGEGLRDGKLGTIVSIGGQECIDFNAYCSDISVVRAVGDNTGEGLVDINESGNITVQSIIGRNSCSSLLSVTSESGARWTEKAARGNSNNVSIHAVKGETTSRAIATNGSNPIQNLTIEGIDVRVTDGVNRAAISMAQEADGQYDGLRLVGRAKCDSPDFGALQYGYVDGSVTGVSQDVYIDLEVSNEKGASVDGMENSELHLRAHDCSFRAVDFAPTCDELDVFINSVGNGGVGLRIRCSNSNFTGTVKNNTGPYNLEIESGADNNRLNIDYDTITNNGANNSEVSHSAL